MAPLWPGAGPGLFRFGPLRDLFAATFFLIFSFSVDPVDLVGVLAPAAVLALIGGGGKVLAGWWAARPYAGGAGRGRAGTVLIARGEFSIVIAALGASTADGPELGVTAAAYVLLTAILGPVATKFSDRFPWPPRTSPSRAISPK